MLLSDKAKELVTKKYEGGNQKRLTHIFGVAEMAELLAKRYDLDVEKALVAAYMHDYCKYDDPKTAIGVLTEDEIRECEEYPFLYHAYLSAEAYKELLGDDEEIYNAIKYHVFGRPGMSMLEAIIMIADYTEKNRTYPSCIECRKILLDGDLNRAIYESLKRTTEYVQSEGQKAAPKQMLVMEEYKKKMENKMSLEEIITENLGRVNAKDILAYDTRERSPFYDEMILASVDSERQATSLISYIEEDASKNGYKVRSVEGENTPWVLIDCNNIIVSVFTKEERNHFAIEKIYMDVPCKKIEY